MDYVQSIYGIIDFDVPNNAKNRVMRVEDLVAIISEIIFEIKVLLKFNIIREINSPSL